MIDLIKNSKKYISIDELEIEDDEKLEEKCITNDSKIRLYEALKKKIMCYNSQLKKQKKLLMDTIKMLF